ncbi:shikimate dehydrogenase [Fluoribacter dumoffii]|uniref:shikimate dehydrogenase n=1 Tax=Fluoribacter dumoffii TaxID=463 RepID=UPI0022439278|nr:shikimate dehydrogenase [Fluoribacter dumoffii]MCW8417312.1 shikimate dehydrogenase [Fluoribacter dumoffii]MCW8454847.1 shikimate dehydrogenase [Fluoribacter dumoffii]MCW8461076.1 shikimate dehydrogenase [Fluoribacter dumoffii]MCW8484517.1 shikimate dehydrogenase [Fluoribacter dumoffii]
MSQRFAVIGNPVAHSLSPIIHQRFAKQLNVQLTYEKIKADEQSFERLVSDFFAQAGKGLNVTLPFKQRAFEMAQQCSVRCQKASAANTLWIKDNQLHADNTDGIGFIRDLNRYFSVADKRVLILGAGGAARGIVHPLLDQHPLELIVANRTLAKTKEFQGAFPQTKCISFNEIKGQFDLVINATSASLVGEFVGLPAGCMSTKPFCYDLAYKQHAPTVFVQYAQESGCQAADGLGMLVEQAAEAFFIWHRIMPATEEVLTFLRTACEDKG